MSGFDTAAVASHLRRLDADGWRSFLEELWRARGFDVSRDGGHLVAERDGLRSVLYPHAGGRDRGQTPSRDADAVVAAEPSARAEMLAERLNARLLTASDVAELLRHGVDRPAAAALCERHLGAHPESLRPPVSVRVRRQVAGAGGGEGWSALAVVAVACALLVVVGVPVAFGAGDPPAAVGESSATDTTAGVGGTDETTSAGATSAVAANGSRGPTEPFAPGVPAPTAERSGGSDVDAERLLAADRAQRANASYRLDRSVTVRWSAEDRYLGLDWVRRVDGDRTTETFSTFGTETSTVVRSQLWQNGSTVRTRTRLSDGTVRTQALPAPPERHTAGLAIPQQVLRADGFRVEPGNFRIEPGDGEVAVLRSTEPYSPSPDVVPVEIREPRSAEALLVVTEDGLIRAATLRFEAERGGERLAISVGYRLSGYNDTSVERPDWAEGSRGTANRKPPG